MQLALKYLRVDNIDAKKWNNIFQDNYEDNIYPRKPLQQAVNNILLFQFPICPL